ncbi:cold-shock protein [Priestia megaterium]|uniref:Cold-shock protein n=2 Tax=Priestia megaterium TaxID=1404 RepID=A0A3D8WVX2_PRIMG|nr:cold-shock protein [Priestia megaterium]
MMESKTGKVKCYDKEKGFGFISPDNGIEELFVHFSSIYNSNSLKVGQEVSYIEFKGHKGPQAEYVMLL